MWGIGLTLCLQLSRPAKDFTPYGQKLRAELFRRLHDQRDQRLFDTATARSVGAGTGAGVGMGASPVERI